jgi:hypothetical protein
MDIGVALLVDCRCGTGDIPMCTSLGSRVARACAAAALVFSLSLTPSLARMGGAGGAHFARPAFGGGHFPHFAPRGFNGRFDSNRFGFNRFGPNRFDRFGFNRFNRFGSNRFNRFGFSRFGGNQLAIGGWGWGGGGWDGWGGAPISNGASEPIIVGDRAPVIINIGADPPRRDASAGYIGACVTHKLLYDSDGKFVGERQTSQC